MCRKSLADKPEMRCPVCGSKRMQRSRFRLPDLLRLLALRRAVRCRDCGQRTFFPVSASAECNQAAFSEPG